MLENIFLDFIVIFDEMMVLTEFFDRLEWQSLFTDSFDMGWKTIWGYVVPLIHFSDGSVHLWKVVFVVLRHDYQ